MLNWCKVTPRRDDIQSLHRSLPSSGAPRRATLLKIPSSETARFQLSAVITWVLQCPHQWALARLVEDNSVRLQCDRATLERGNKWLHSESPCDVAEPAQARWLGTKQTSKPYHKVTGLAALARNNQSRTDMVYMWASMERFTPLSLFRRPSTPLLSVRGQDKDRERADRRAPPCILASSSSPPWTRVTQHGRPSGNEGDKIQHVGSS